MVVLGAMHVVPCVFMAIEFFKNGIHFYWRHYFLFFALSVGYLGVNLLQSFLSKDKSAIYPCLDWHRRPDVAAGVVVAFILLEFFVFWILVRLTNIKLKKSFLLQPVIIVGVNPS